MSRCRCPGALTVEGCLCSYADSNCINVSGMGSVADPLRFDPIFDSDPDNLASCGANGLLSRLPANFRSPPRIKIHYDAPWSGPPNLGVTYIPFNTIIYSSGFAWSAGDPTRVPIPVDGMYEVKFHIGIEPDTEAPNAIRADVMKNETTRICYTVVWTSGNWPTVVGGIGTRLRDSTFVELNTGDKLKLRVQNNATIALDSEPNEGMDNVLEVIWRCKKVA